jgi:hypothetical protein
MPLRKTPLPRHCEEATQSDRESSLTAIAKSASDEANLDGLVILAKKIGRENVVLLKG